MLEKVLCWKCRKLVTYTISEKERTTIINGHKYKYIKLYALCTECGSNIYVPGSLDENSRRLDKISE